MYFICRITNMQDCRYIFYIYIIIMWGLLWNKVVKCVCYALFFPQFFFKSPDGCEWWRGGGRCPPPQFFFFLRVIWWLSICQWGGGWVGCPPPPIFKKKYLSPINLLLILTLLRWLFVWLGGRGSGEPPPLLWTPLSFFF